MRQDLLDKINDFSKSLAKVSKWKNTKDAFGHIVTYDTDKEKIAENNYIYEFYCYMKIIEDLDKNPNHIIKFKNCSGIFPKSPAPKIGRPYFVLEIDGKEVFQVCSGTKIQTKISTIKKAPDISFQSMSADDKTPSYKDILAIYDAKYSQSKKVNSFQEGQMVLFSDMIKLLKLKKPIDLSMYYTDFKDFKGNCLLTNKKSFTNDLDLLKHYKMTIVEDFDEKQKFNVIK